MSDKSMEQPDSSPSSAEKPWLSQHIESGFIQPIAALLHPQQGSVRPASSASSPAPREKTSSSGGNSLRSEQGSPQRLTNLFDKYPKTFFKAESPEYVIEEAKKPDRLVRLGPGKVVEERIGKRSVVEVRELPPRVRSESVSRGSAHVVSEVELTRQRRSVTPSARSRPRAPPERVNRERLVETVRERPVAVERFVDVHRDVVVNVPIERTIEKEIVTEVRVEREVEKIVEIPIEYVYEVPVERIVEKLVEVIRWVEVPVERIVERLVDVVLEEIVVKKVYIDVDERDLHLYPGVEREPTRVERHHQSGLVDRSVINEQILERTSLLPLPRDECASNRVIELPLRIEQLTERAQPIDRVIEVAPEIVREAVHTVERVIERPVHHEVELQRRVEVLVERRVEVPVERLVEIPVEIRVPRPVFIERCVETDFPVDLRETVWSESIEERVEEITDAGLEELIAQRRQEVERHKAANARRRQDLRLMAAKAESLAGETAESLRGEYLCLLAQLFELQAVEETPGRACALSARTVRANELTDQLRAAVAENSELMACLRHRQNSPAKIN